MTGLNDWRLKFDLEQIHQLAAEIVATEDPEQILKLLRKTFGLKQSLGADLRKAQLDREPTSNA